MNENDQHQKQEERRIGNFYRSQIGDPGSFWTTTYEQEGVWILGQVKLLKKGDLPLGYRKRLAFRVPKEITEQQLLAIFKQKEFDVVFRDAIR
jgi:hypothetical protein